VALCSLLGSDQTQIALTEMLIRVIIVVGLSMFVGNTGVLSFGHIGFMCVGAYAAAWASCDPDPSASSMVSLREWAYANRLQNVAGEAVSAREMAGALLLWFAL
jgi:ABC-type branched-subunit amino acid transport system permease subunit